MTQTATTQAVMNVVLRSQGCDFEEIVHDFFAHVHFEEHEFLPLAQEILSRHGEMAALGLALHKQQKLDEAVAEFRKAIDIDPKFAEAQKVAKDDARIRTEYATVPSPRRAHTKPSPAAPPGRTPRSPTGPRSSSPAPAQRSARRRRQGRRAR